MFIPLQQEVSFSFNGMLLHHIKTQAISFIIGEKLNETFNTLLLLSLSFSSFFFPLKSKKSILFSQHRAKLAKFFTYNKGKPNIAGIKGSSLPLFEINMNIFFIMFQVIFTMHHHLHIHLNSNSFIFL